jgi:hypothetical protein
MLTQEIKRDIIFRRLNPPISKVDYRTTMTSSTSELNSSPNSFLPAIYWASEVHQSIYDASKYDGNKPGKPLIMMPDWDRSLSPPPFFNLSPSSPWNHDTKILTHANTITPDTHADSVTHSYITLSLTHVSIDIFIRKYSPQRLGARDRGGS